MNKSSQKQQYGDVRRETLASAYPSRFGHLAKPAAEPSAAPVVQSKPPANVYSRSVQEIIPVAAHLGHEIGDPKFQSVLLRVKEQSGVNSIIINRRADNSAETITVDAPDTASALLAKTLIETHIKQHQKLMAASAKLHEMQTSLFMVQGEMASNISQEFYVKPELIGFVIGKKGSKIRETEQIAGVTSINVDGDLGKIIVYGPDASSVQKARDILEIEEEKIDLETRHTEYYIRERDDSINDLKSTSGLLMARLDRDNGQMIFIGSKNSLKAARLLLNTQLNYVDKILSMDEESREARKQLNTIKQQYMGGGSREPREREYRDREPRNREPRDRDTKDREPRERTEKTNRGDRETKTHEKESKEQPQPARKVSEAVPKAPEVDRSQKSAPVSSDSKKPGRGTVLAAAAAAVEANNQMKGSTASRTAESATSATTALHNIASTIAEVSEKRNEKSKNRSRDSNGKGSSAPQPTVSSTDPTATTPEASKGKKTVHEVVKQALDAKMTITIDNNVTAEPKTESKPKNSRERKKSNNTSAPSASDPSPKEPVTEAPRTAPNSTTTAAVSQKSSTESAGRGKNQRKSQNPPAPQVKSTDPPVPPVDPITVPKAEAVNPTLQTPETATPKPPSPPVPIAVSAQTPIQSVSPTPLSSQSPVPIALVSAPIAQNPAKVLTPPPGLSPPKGANPESLSLGGSDIVLDKRVRIPRSGTSPGPSSVNAMPSISPEDDVLKNLSANLHSNPLGMSLRGMSDGSNQSNKGVIGKPK